MSAVLQRTWTRDAFLDWVERQEAPYGFDGTHPVPMDGGTYAHSLIGRDVVFALHFRLRSTGLVVLGAGAGIATTGAAVRYPDAHFPEVGASVPLSEIYGGVDLPGFRGNPA